MKRILILLTATSLLAACSKSNSGDKKTELESLKKQLQKTKEKEFLYIFWARRIFLVIQINVLELVTFQK